MDKTHPLADRSGTRRGPFPFFRCMVGALLLTAFSIGLLLGGCTDYGSAPVVLAATPVTGTTTTKATAQASFDKFLAKINAFNANVAKDNGSPAQQQLLIDATGAALAGAVTVAGEGKDSGADVAALAGANKAISDIAQLPSVQSTKSAQVKAAVTAAVGTGNNATALASKAALIFDAATAKGATPQSTLFAINQGYTQAQSQAATAAVAQAAVPPVVAAP